MLEWPMVMSYILKGFHIIKQIDIIFQCSSTTQWEMMSHLKNDTEIFYIFPSNDV